MICQGCDSIPASGLFEVTEQVFRSTQIKHMFLCAACGFSGMYAKRRMVDASTRHESITYFVAYVLHVKLLQGFNRPEGLITPGGLKANTLGVDDTKIASGQDVPNTTRTVQRLGGRTEITDDSPRIYCQSCQDVRNSVVARLVNPKTNRRMARAWCTVCATEGHLMEES